MVELGHMLEMMGMSHQNAIIELEFGKKGSIFLYQGVIEHAVSYTGYNQTQGMKALGQLLQLENTQFRILAYQSSKRSSINLPVRSALSEAARLVDEEKRYQSFIDSVRKTCPTVTAVAIGYPLSMTPILGFGEATELFKKARELLDKSREALGSKADEFLIITDELAYALVSFNEGNIIIAAAPAKNRGLLYKALKEATQSVPA